MKYLIFAFTLFIVQAATAQRIRVDQRQAKEAYELLNRIRLNPEKYKRELKLFNLHKIKRTELRWNKQLAEVAVYRAKDMAKRAYFDHVSPEGYGPNYFIAQAGYALNPDWLKKRSANNFESIAANRASATDAIKALIIGREAPGYHHRTHLLGMDQWNGSLYDVGIGYVTCKGAIPYESYLVVIIAKHGG
ncbi:CAP domain-containing protein [Sphingobacterium sp. InxBP1]|uniref:CAP domain-containing protein n=1 Tax=Sphingobacterium sp. InxBP1 TaxID=2870328 RepID=UPI002244434A|nr:CAP domain-containing protein [Sphingobacterium sp. InxBP1]MCW8311013.1 CAP domain-containing protein [Sphingobacterium sp. InxBP1]